MSVVGRRLGQARYVVLLGVVGLLTTALATFALAIFKTIKLVSNLFSGGWADELMVVAVLEAVDSYLLAVVQMIVVFGLYELFVGDLDLPGWLEVRSLEDLKKPIVDVLVVFVAIKAIERYLLAGDAGDALVSAAAGAVLILSLTAFRVLAAPKGAPGAYNAAVTPPTDHTQER